MSTVSPTSSLPVSRFSSSEQSPLSKTNFPSSPKNDNRIQRIVGHLVPIGTKAEKESRSSSSSSSIKGMHRISKIINHLAAPKTASAGKMQSTSQEQGTSEFFSLSPEELLYLCFILKLPSFNPKDLNTVKKAQCDCFDRVFSACLDDDRSTLEKATPYLDRLTNEKGANILHHAVRRGEHPLIDRLFAKYYHQMKGLREKKDTKGRTPLALAAYLGEPFCITVLAKYGANLVAKNKEEWQPIHFACAGQQLESVDCLATYGVDLTALDKRSRSPEKLLPEDSYRSEQIYGRLLTLRRDQSKKEHSHFDLSPETLVFQGGGAKGLGYVGALRELENRQALGRLERVAGTSAGALTALLIALGYNSQEIYKIFVEKTLTAYLEHVDFYWVRPWVKVLWKGYQHEGEKLREWIEEDLIQSKIKQITGKPIPYLTFGDLKHLINQRQHFPPEKRHFKHLHVVGTKLGQMPTLKQTVSPDPSVEPSQIVDFNSEDDQWNNLIISDAVRISMSIPGFLQTHTLYYKAEDGQRKLKENSGRYIDGGLLCNFPNLFDRKKFKKGPVPKEEEHEPWHNPRTWGFIFMPSRKEASPTEPPSPAPSTIFEVGKVTAATFRRAEDTIRELHKDPRIVKIDPLGVGATDFDLDVSKKEALIASGAQATRNFLKDYEKGRVGKSPLFYDYGLFTAKEAEGFLRIPRPRSDFIGRKQELQALAEFFVQETNYREATKVKVLYSPSGYGKSQLALTFACAHLSQFSFIWQLDFRNKTTLTKTYRELAKTLGFFQGKDPSLEELRLFVNQLLEKQLQPWLLIFDNVDDDITLHLPQKGGAILITTTRKTGWRSEETWPVKPFSQKEAVDFLREVLDSKEELPLRTLAAALGHIPLLLSYAAYYIAHSPGVSIDTYRKTLPRFDTPADYQKVLTHVVQSSLISLQKQNPEAVHWLQLCIHLNNQAIPIEWLDRHLALHTQDKNSWERYLIKHEILEQLRHFAFIYFHKYDDTFSFHGFLQKTLSSSLSSPTTGKELVQIFCQGSYTLSLATPAPVLQNLSLQGEAIASLIERENYRLLEIEEVEEFYFDLASLHETLAEYHQALRNYQAVLPMLKKDSGESSSQVARCLNGMGFAYQGLGEAGKELFYFEKALEMRKFLYPDPHPEVAASLNNVGTAYQALGEVRKGLSYCEEALKMYQAFCQEKDHPNIAISLNNVGSAYQDLGEARKALLYYEKALEMYQTLYPGICHPDVVTSLNNVGSVYQDLGEARKALFYHGEALKMGKTLYGGRDHPNIARSLNTLGIAYQALGELRKALFYYEEALKMRKSLYPDAPHPAVAASLNGVGNAYLALGEVKKALFYYEEALKMNCTLYPDVPHPEVAWNLNSVGNAYLALGEVKKGLSYCEKALKISRALYPNVPHPEVAWNLNSVGNAYLALGKVGKALFYYKETLKMNRTLHPDVPHPEVASSLNNVGNTYQALGELRKALFYYEEALKMRKALYPDTPHPEVAMSLNNVGVAYQALGEVQKGLSYCKEALKINKILYPDIPHHESSIKGLSKL
ncbi:MAG: tetratricopeptide repeat protein [Simkania negevensis]|nr:tetratricopeptide repeat protein [Simkania negevensis]